MEEHCRKHDDKKRLVFGFLIGACAMGILVIVMLIAALFFAKNGSTLSLPQKTAGGDQAADNSKPSTAGENALSVGNLKKYASGLGLDANKFNQCLDSGKYAQKIKDQTKEGQAIGVSGTPDTFINGYPISGAYDISLFKEVIDSILAGKDVRSVENYKKIFKTGTVPDPVNIDTSKDYVRGVKGGKIMLIEFSDFQCPFCKRHETTIQQLMKDYNGKIGLVYKNFPLPFHEYAQKAAEAAECAGEQGKFWEMHDKLFSLE